MNDYKLKVLLTVLASILFSFIFIILALVLPAKESDYAAHQDHPQTEFQKMSKGMREGFKK